jgi:thioredoxin reductase
MHDLVIIGAGPAGLAAALYAMKKRMKYLVLSETLGGKGNYSVRLPEAEEHQAVTAKGLITVYRSRLQYLRHSYRLESVEKIERADDRFTLTTRSGAVESARTVIVATGTKTPHLNVPGEGELLGKHLGTSSISYSHLLYGKSVFVVGDSDRVLRAAVELSIQAERVTVALMPEGTFTPALLEAVSNRQRVELIQNATVTRFSGAENAESVTFSAGDSERTLTADAFFVEPHPDPNVAVVRPLLERAATADAPALTDDGFIIVDGRNRTGIPGLFAAGDVTNTGFEQALIALGEGTTAALAAYEYVMGHD